MPSAHKFQRTERGAEPVEDMEMYSDEDLEGGFEDVEDAEDDVVDAEPDDVTERVPSTSSHYAIPSNEEIHGLKETSDLYMNNVFKLQLDEMRKHMPPSATHKPAMDDFLRHVQQCLVAIEAIEPQPLSAAIRALERRVGCRVHVPFAEPVPRGDPAYAIGFEAPRTLHLVGSWPLQTAVRRPGDMDVDVEAVMPSTLFQEKDTLNARYFTKRAFYLAVLAAHLRQESTTFPTPSWVAIGAVRAWCCAPRPFPSYAPSYVFILRTSRASFPWRAWRRIATICVARLSVRQSKIRMRCPRHRCTIHVSQLTRSVSRISCT